MRIHVTKTSPVHAIAAIAAAALALAGCSSGGYSAGVVSGAAGAGPGVPAASVNPAVLDGVPAAAARTLSQTAAVGFRLEGAQVFGPVHAPVFGQGAFDFSSGRGSVVIDLPEARHQEPGTEHVIFFPTRVYLQPKGGALAVLPKGKRWLSATIAGSESVNRNFPQFVGQVEGVNPMLLLAELAWGAATSVPLGPGRQIVDHVPAQRYRVSVDLTRALSAASGPGAAALGQAIQEQLTALSSGSSSARSPSVSILTWVDRAGRVVQMQTSLPGAGEGTELAAVSYFGTKPQLAIPPPSQVVDITALTPSGERENNGGGDTDGG
jgi:hypothetical protein